MSKIPCPACVDPADGKPTGADPSDPAMMAACPRCGGWREIEGRPSSWPPAGSTLRSTERLDSYEVLAGEPAQWTNPGVIPARAGDGSPVGIRADFIGTKYTIDQGERADATGRD